MSAEHVSTAEVTRPAADTRTAEDWARATWEGAPAPLRAFMLTGWRMLGFELGPRPSPEHVLGWPILKSTPDMIVLQVPSKFLDAQNMVELTATKVHWTTTVRPSNATGRTLWRVAEPLHVLSLPLVLNLAAGEGKHHVVTTVQRGLVNPLMRRLPGQVLLETTGRNSGEPRVTPIGGRRVGREFWFVSEFGEKSQYVRNILAQPRVRLRLHGRWHEGTAQPVPGDDVRARLASLPRMNSAAVRSVGTNLLTIRVALD